jgi:hypothetical protein
MQALKSWQVGHLTGEPVLTLETFSGQPFVVMMSPRAARELGAALLRQADQSNQQTQN